jgi:hypothetical protein
VHWRFYQHISHDIIIVDFNYNQKQHTTINARTKQTQIKPTFALHKSTKNTFSQIHFHPNHKKAKQQRPTEKNRKYLEKHPQNSILYSSQTSVLNPRWSKQHNKIKVLLFSQLGFIYRAVHLRLI